MIYYDKKNCVGMKKSRIFAVEKSLKYPFDDKYYDIKGKK